MLKDYKCTSCETISERFVKSSDPVPTCEHCGAEMIAVITASYKIRMDDAPNRPCGKRYT